MSTSPPSDVERIKQASCGLRGGISDGLADAKTGAVSNDDQALIKFHGIYQQDDRDTRQARDKRKLEPDYSFMIRLRVPGGLVSAQQWATIDEAARMLSRAQSIRLTTRQTLQFHGVAKENLSPLLQACKQQLLDSIAACGDVNRNVMCSSYAKLWPFYHTLHESATAISQYLLPKTRAYYEIWLNEERIASSEKAEEDPLYKTTYLPRKFKIGIAIPPINDVDVYSQDIGFVAIVTEGVLTGYNVIAGGGLGMTHGMVATHPQLGHDIGFCTLEQAPTVAWHIAAWQRDNGNRSERKLSRLKYTILRRGGRGF